MKALSQKMTLLDQEKMIMAQSIKEDVCGKYMAANTAQFIFNTSNFPPTEVDLNYLSMSSNSASPNYNINLLEKNIKIPGSNLMVNRIYISNIIGSGTDYNAKLKVVTSGGIRQFADIQSSVKLSLQQTGNQIKITGCPGVDQADVFNHKIYFGGGYGYNYNHPTTGGQSCPAGYATLKILGKINEDYPGYICYRDSLDTISPMPTQYFAFGGMYGDSGGHENPYTGTQGCPAGQGYIPRKMMGTTNVDYGLYYCYKALAAGVKPDDSNSKIFAGLYATNISDAVTVNNPFTSAANCPAGFVSKDVYGKTNQDWPVWLCWKI
jgi:hypothetical protein